MAEQCARSMRSRYDYRKPSHNYFLYVENVPSPLVSSLPIPPRPSPLKPPVSSLFLSSLFLLLPPDGWLSLSLSPSPLAPRPPSSSLSLKTRSGNEARRGLLLRAFQPDTRDAFKVPANVNAALQMIYRNRCVERATPTDRQSGNRLLPADRISRAGKFTRERAITFVFRDNSIFELRNVVTWQITKLRPRLRGTSFLFLFLFSFFFFFGFVLMFDKV